MPRHASPGQSETAHHVKERSKEFRDAAQLFRNASLLEMRDGTVVRQQQRTGAKSYSKMVHMRGVEVPPRMCAARGDNLIRGDTSHI